MRMKIATRFVGPVLSGVLMMAVTIFGQSGATNGEWRYYGGDSGTTKYSPLEQITKDNFRDLRIVWRWKTENFGPRPDFVFEATPLMVGGILYTTAGSRRDVVAIDAATGETLWLYRYDEGSRGLRAPIRSASGRGVAYWSDGKEARILHVTQGYHLIALDAKTGQPIASFGKAGVVDLYQGLERPVTDDGQIGWNSPPLVIRDVAVIGAALRGGATKEFVAGFVRGFDVRTGKQIWLFHTIAQPGEVGNETWEKDSWSYTGHTGAWAPFSADDELGYVYLPIEGATNDTYGGHRPGANLFANSLVCVDAKTGKRIWHFQLTHHDVWDYDLPAPPTLVDVTVNGKRVKAVAQVTKQAFTYVFDRVTGQPLWPIIERPVPQSALPGEKSSPTQPIPTKPAPFDRQGIGLDDLIDFTPALKQEAVKIASRYKLGPLFTPAILTEPNGLRGTLVLPGSSGGANWQGAAADPETGMLYVASGTLPGVSGLTPNRDLKRSNMDYVSGGGGAAEQANASAPVGCGEMGPQGLPLLKGPWGRITAIDLNTGEHVWMVPNSETPDCVKNHPALKDVSIPKTGRPDRSGLMVTKTLLFAGEGGGRVVPPWAGGPMFRAYDKKTGAIVGELRLPGNQQGIPMTYMVNGKQFIVVAIGGANVSAELVALALP